MVYCVLTSCPVDGWTNQKTLPPCLLLEDEEYQRIWGQHVLPKRLYSFKTSAPKKLQSTFCSSIMTLLNCNGGMTELPLESPQLLSVFWVQSHDLYWTSKYRSWQPAQDDAQLLMTPPGHKANLPQSLRVIRNGLESAHTTLQPQKRQVMTIWLCYVTSGSSFNAWPRSKNGR